MFEIEMQQASTIMCFPDEVEIDSHLGSVFVVKRSS